MASRCTQRTLCISLRSHPAPGLHPSEYLSLVTVSLLTGVFAVFPTQGLPVLCTCTPRSPHGIWLTGSVQEKLGALVLKAALQAG